jgi:hypothetical protein
MAGNTANWAVNNSGAGVSIDTLTTTGAFTNTAGTTTVAGTFSTGAQTLIAGTLTLNGSTTSSGSFTHTAGALVVNGLMSTTAYSGSNANVRSLTLTRPWTLSGTGTVFTNGTSTNATYTCAPGGYFVISDTSTTSKTVTVNGSSILNCFKYSHGSVTGGWTATP